MGQPEPAQTDSLLETAFRRIAQRGFDSRSEKAIDDSYDRFSQEVAECKPSQPDCAQLLLVRARSVASLFKRNLLQPLCTSDADAFWETTSPCVVQGSYINRFLRLVLAEGERLFGERSAEELGTRDQNRTRRLAVENVCAALLKVSIGATGVSRKMTDAIKRIDLLFARTWAQVWLRLGFVEFVDSDAVAAISGKDRTLDFRVSSSSSHTPTRKASDGKKSNKSKRPTNDATQPLTGGPSWMTSPLHSAQRTAQRSDGGKKSNRSPTRGAGRRAGSNSALLQDNFIKLIYLVIGEIEKSNAEGGSDGVQKAKTKRTAKPKDASSSSLNEDDIDLALGFSSAK